MFYFRLHKENKPTDTFSFKMALMFIINLVRLTATSVHITAIMVLVFAARRATLVIEMPLSLSAPPPTLLPAHIVGRNLMCSEPSTLRLRTLTHPHTHTLWCILQQ